MAYTADPTVSAALERALGARDIALTLHNGGIENALTEAQHDAGAECVIVDVRDSYDAVDDLAALQAVLPRHCRLIAIAERMSAGLQRDMADAGAYAVLDVQLQPDALDAVFGPVEAAEEKPGPTGRTRNRGRVVGVLGTRGGVGATTTAVGLAWLLAHELGRETALLDLDPFFGSLALALNLEPGDGLRQALERPSRLDSVFIDRAVRKVGDRLYVLSAELTLDQPGEQDPKAPLALIESLRRQFERVVIDMPRGNLAWQSMILSKADEVVLVTDLSLAGARDTMRLLAFARHCSTSSRIRVLVGGARQPQNDMLDINEFRRTVGAPVEASIPFDPRAAIDAGRLGRPLPKAAARSPASKAYRGLLTALEGAAQGKDRGRWSLPWRR
jgi:pilus assembly protein CpaE